LYVSLNFPQLSENQNLRAQQLIKHTKDNRERIENSIRTYSKNWSYERIGKVEIIVLTLGISELIMDLTPKKVVISEWVKLCDKHSSSQSAKFVNGILDTISEKIKNE
jgi:N utilization substance protein B